MREPVVYNVDVVIVIQATEVFTSDALHLIRKLEAIPAVLDENDSHFVGPLINEQQSSPNMYSIVSSKPTQVVNKCSIVRKKIHAWCFSGVIVRSPIVVVAVVPEDIIIALATHLIDHCVGLSSCIVKSTCCYSASQRRRSQQPVFYLRVGAVVAARC